VRRILSRRFQWPVTGSSHFWRRGVESNIIAYNAAFLKVVQRSEE
jgi:hypothetical protein